MTCPYGTSRVDDLTFTGFLLAASTVFLAVIWATKTGQTATGYRIWAGALFGMTAIAFASEIAAIVRRRRYRR